jgi:hypothetical protein
VKHLTMTGPAAGTYFCREFISVMGQGTIGERKSGDEAAHYAYAPESWLTASDLCPKCKHVADCLETNNISECFDCESMGIS